MILSKGISQVCIKWQLECLIFIIFLWIDRNNKLLKSLKAFIYNVTHSFYNFFIMIGSEFTNVVLNKIEQIA